ncbi:uncharacterized protein BJ212DRAFT_116383 [Suillus subaureus]|uniref:Uncharacterized protein n=1 Tax=Suillus subaureus TaxID=48587 RepID=A0A9P7JEF9_9AGAM|nr:uncharacterized protein BJ212DRAFT_116383 [Suillus subaureus]KAG1817958.1 hypothetical protein BJ212DRAFT_116383 [Suillus subaureus]
MFTQVSISYKPFLSDVDSRVPLLWRLLIIISICLLGRIELHLHKNSSVSETAININANKPFTNHFVSRLWTQVRSCLGKLFMTVLTCAHRLINRLHLRYSMMRQSPVANPFSANLNFHLIVAYLNLNGLIVYIVAHSEMRYALHAGMATMARLQMHDDLTGKLSLR